MTPHERTEAHFLKVAKRLKAEAGAKVLRRKEHHNNEHRAHYLALLEN
jgi:hypothetical protein